MLSRSTCAAIRPSSARQGRSPLQVRAASSSSSSKTATKEFCAGLPGNTSPMDNFDPLNFLEGKDDNTIKRYREAELTHGRVSMVAAVGFIVAENFNPLFDESITGPAVGHFQQLPANFWFLILAAIGFVEYGRAQKGWVDPTAGEGLFKLKDDYVPGDIGWDPLGLKPTDKAEFDVMQTRELNNGRLAMFAILGEIVQELVTGKELFNLEDDKLLNEANCPPGVICDILEGSG